MWVTNTYGDTVTELRGSDGALLGTFDVGGFPKGIGFDAANIWVANVTDATLTELRADDPDRKRLLPVNQGPQEVAFAGHNVWVTNFDSNTVEVFRARTGALRTQYDIPLPISIVFDGTSMWVTSVPDDGRDVVVKISPNQ